MNVRKSELLQNLRIAEQRYDEAAAELDRLRAEVAELLPFVRWALPYMEGEASRLHSVAANSLSMEFTGRCAKARAILAKTQPTRIALADDRAPTSPI